MKKFWTVTGGLFVALMLLIAFKTVTYTSLQKRETPNNGIRFNSDAPKHLSKAITYQTVSRENGLPIDSSAFQDFVKFLIRTYPLTFSRLETETFSDFSMLLTWKGRHTSLKPIILTAHFDVVPAKNPEHWLHEPFSGKNDGTYIWGRGSLDDKASLISILEAIEQLLTENYCPNRTLYLAFGHDEETGGKKGAQIIAKTLKKRHIRADFILDEGMAVVRNTVPLIQQPVALIGTSEKGHASIRLSVETKEGHASTPEDETAVSILVKALNKLSNHRNKAEICPSVKDFFRYLGPEMPWFTRTVFANTWLFEKILLGIYKATPSGRALVTTSITPTMLRAGEKSNVVPAKAEAVLDVRMLPGNTVASVLKNINTVIADPRVHASLLEWADNPTPTSPIFSFGFDVLQKTIGQVYPEAIVAPALMLASSDSRNYCAICKNIYRFAPLYIDSKDLSRIHGTNERINIHSFFRGINFYYRLIKNGSSPQVIK